MADPGQAAALLAAAMYLSVGSCLASRRLPASQVLIGLFELLPASGRLCDHDLVSCELDLNEAVRLRLAELALADLSQLPAAERPAWAGVLLALLDDREVVWQFGTRPQRLWLAAKLADLYREGAGEVIARWQAADEPEQPEAYRRYSRLRRLEILAGCDRRRLAVPRYSEAHRLAVLLLPADDAEQERRCRQAMALIEYRRPASSPSRGWISASVTPGDTVLAVYWWGDEPRDVACWRPAEGPEAIEEYLAAAGGRVLWEADGPTGAVLATWPAAGRGRSLEPYLETMLEPMLPAEGWHRDLARRLALARSGPWQAGWRDDLGHPLLAPPGRDGRLTAAQAEIEPALWAGLLWLAVQYRVETADPALRAGLGELARRGDPAAAFLHDQAVLGRPDQAAVDAGFGAWTLPMLWVRPDPLSTAPAGDDQQAEQEDLAGHDVAVVITGRPGRVLPAWGASERRWRVVLDRLDRLGGFRRLARECVGPVTVVPPDGQVHDLQAALRLLAEWAAAAATAPPAQQMLAICHWIRLVETHNGDLLDLCQLRPRVPGALPGLELYASRLAALPRRAVADATAADDGSWEAQYAQRARRSGLVIGRVDDLPDHAGALDSVWGVFDGSGASWVFCDTAAVHWRLHERRLSPLPQLHSLFASRGRRHLSLLSGRGLYHRDLVVWLDSLLVPYGRPYHLDLGDAHPPVLRLAGSAPLPDSRLDPALPLLAALGRLEAAAAGTRVRLPRSAPAADFWRAAAAGAFGPPAWRLAEDRSLGDAASLLVVPVWNALAEAAELQPPAGADTPEAWQVADRRRQEHLARLRTLLALECAALLAGPAARIEVLDPRWWRLFCAPEQMRDPAVTGAESCEIVDLFADGLGEEQRRLSRAITAWLAERGQLGGVLPGWDGLPLLAAQPLGSARAAFHLTPAAAHWRDQAADLLRAWEHGQPVGRLLLIAETPPAGAAALAAACAGMGATVMSASPGQNYGALLWVQPAQLTACLAQGCALPVSERALLFDFDAHCPPAGSTVEGAWLLAKLAGGLVPRLDLVGGPRHGAWSRFLDRRFGAAPGEVPEPSGWTTVRRGVAPKVPRLCPQCGQQALRGPDDLVCSQCSFDLGGGGLTPEGVDLFAVRVRGLFSQVDLGRDEPLEIWSGGGSLAAVRAALEHLQAQPKAGACDAWRLPDGRQWHLRSLSRSVPAAAGPAILLQPPSEPTVLRPWTAGSDDPSLTMLYDRLEVAAPGPGAQKDATRRLWRLLGESGWLRSPPLAHLQADPAAMVPFWQLAWSAGLALCEVRREFAQMLWLAGLAGEVVPNWHGGQSVSGRMQWRVNVSWRDAEQRLARLAARLEPLLAEWLAGGMAGSWRAVRAAGLPQPDPTGTQAAGASLDWQLDLLLGWLAAVPQTTSARLVYLAPEGAWFSARRLVGWLGDRRRLSEHLAQQIERLVRWLRSALADASVVDVGFTVAAPTLAPPPSGQPDSVDAMGMIVQMLGFWSRLTPDEAQQVPVAQLRQLSASQTVNAGGPGFELAQELAAARDLWRQRLLATPTGGRVVAFAAQPQPDAGQRRLGRWLRRDRGQMRLPLLPEVAAWLQGPAPARLVLAGHYGSGRTDSLLAAMAASELGRRAEFWCPDAGTAVRVHLAARRLDAAWQPQLHVPPIAGPLPPRFTRVAGERPVTVIIELQRFPRPIAYQLQEWARDSHLLLTVDVCDLEPQTTWEDLFLTTPARDEIRQLRNQVLQASQPWRVVRPFLTAEVGENTARRGERGLVQLRSAGTLDECVRAIAAAVENQQLERQVTIVAPLRQDVQLLAQALGDCGWAAVAERDLEPLFGPGVLETMAGLADAHRRLSGVWPGLARTSPPAAAPWALGSLLPAQWAAEYAAWLQGMSADILSETASFLAHLRRSPWGVRCGAPPAAWAWLAARANERIQPADLFAPPLWDAWRGRLETVLGQREQNDGPPIACLATATEAVSMPARSLVYICFGSEPASVHRRILLRATDRLLILYQEHSPLPFQWEV